MKKIFGSKKKKEKPPPVTVADATEKINRRGDIADEKIKKLDAELLIFKEQIKNTRSRAAQDALKARALRILKQKKMYEAQRGVLYNQSFKLEHVSLVTEGIKDAQEMMAAMKAGNKDLQGTLKMLKIDDVDKLQDVITNMEESNEMQDLLAQGHSAPDHVDEDDLLGELDALEADIKTQKCTEGGAVFQPDNTEVERKVNLPSAPREQTTDVTTGVTQQTPQASLQMHEPLFGILAFVYMDVGILADRCNMSTEWLLAIHAYTCAVYGAMLGDHVLETVLAHFIAWWINRITGS